ncbi:hypothetical protein GCM10012279_49370 [Micromonospora yangpuensis]|nr:hypothetical protein GCM10012279_49370 [Micromonospora yangpuensis]
MLRVLREHAEAMNAKEIQEVVTGRTPAYTTLLTALDRLHKKGQVERVGESPRKMRFRPVLSGEEHASTTMLSALDDATDRHAALLRFAGNLNPDDLAMLRRAISPDTATR